MCGLYFYCPNNNKTQFMRGSARLGHRDRIAPAYHKWVAHVTNLVATEHPSKHRRNPSVTPLRLYDHWNMMIY